MRTRNAGAGALLLLMCSAASAADQLKGLNEQFEAAARAANSSLIAPAMATAGIALALQWILSHWKEIFEGDMSKMFVKSIACITWFAASVYLLKHMDMFSTMFSKYLDLAAKLAGAGNGVTVSMQPGDVIFNGIAVLVKVNWAITKAAAVGATSEYTGIVGEISKAAQNLNPLGNLLVILLTVFADVFIFLCYMIIAASVFMARIEFWLMFAVAPLAISLIPLQAFREQGFAPIKGLISLGLRLIILAVIVGVANAFSLTLVDLLDKGLPANEYLFVPVWSFLAGVCMCAICAGYAGKIASSIASGSASFSGADIIGGGAKIAATAAVGAAAVGGAVAGGSAIAGGAANAGRGALSMLQKGGELINKLSGGPSAPVGAGGAAPASALGGSPIQARPSAESAFEGNSSAAVPGSGSDSGGANGTAGIGGTDNGLGKQFQNFSNNGHKAGQTDAPTEIKMNLSGGD